MRAIHWMQPRDKATAGQTVALLGGVAIAVTVLTYPILPTTGESASLVLEIVAAVAFAILGALIVAIRFLGEAGRVAWAVCPLLAVVAIVLVDLATHDASIRAQIFFVFTTLYGCVVLPRAGAVVVTAWSILGEAVVALTLLPLREGVGNLAYMAATLVAVAVFLVRSGDAQAALVAVLERRAATDSLTGLVTRRVFDEAAASALLSQPTTDGTALILLDVDKFKSINDQHGHPGGDAILVQISMLLLEGARRGDVVCRLGGDEMAVLLPGCSAEVALRRAEDLLLDVRTHAFVVDRGTSVAVSVSVGVAHAPSHALELRDLYSAADAALYQAKRSGRDRVVEHTGPPRPRVAGQSTIVAP